MQSSKFRWLCTALDWNFWTLKKKKKKKKKDRERSSSLFLIHWPEQAILRTFNSQDAINYFCKLTCVFSENNYIIVKDVFRLACHERETRKTLWVFYEDSNLEPTDSALRCPSWRLRIFSLSLASGKTKKNLSLFVKPSLKHTSFLLYLTISFL